MLIILRNNLWAFVKDSRPIDDRIIYDTLSIKVEGARFSPAYKQGRWDGYERLYSLSGRYFPSGLISTVEKELIRKGIPFKVKEARKAPKAQIKSLAVVAPYLREDQKEAAQTAIAQTGGIIQAATGSGKTLLAVAITRALDLPTLFLVNQADLMHQAANQYLARGGTTVGKIGEGLWEPHPEFTVATIQTLHRRLSSEKVQNFLAGIQVLFVDECHGVAAKSSYKVAMSTKNTYYRFGLSGTPLDRTDGRNLRVVAALGPVIYKLSSGEAISQNLLSKAEINFIEPSYIGYDLSLTGSYFRVYKHGIEFCEERNKLITHICNVANKPALVFCNTVRHACAVRDGLQEVGLRTELVWGAWGGEARLEALQKLGKGILEVVVSSPVFDSGIDLPELQSVIIAAGGKSPIKLLQRIGRGMRKTSTKSTFEVWDIFDSAHRYLANHTWDRIRVLKREGFTVNRIKEEDIEKKKEK